MKKYSTTNSQDAGVLSRIMAVFRKEMRDHTRDRRSLLLALVYPLLGPILVSVSLAYTGNSIQSSSEHIAFDLLVMGSENAPELIDYIKEDGIRVIPVADYDIAHARVKKGDIPVALVVPESAKDKKRFEVQLLMNLGRIKNFRFTSHMDGVISNYNKQQSQQDLKDAGFGEDFAFPVKVKDVFVAERPSIAVFFYNMMPPLVIFMIFLGGVHLAIDTTVGERERGSLEPLLLAPMERWGLLLAKAMATLAFTAITTLVNLAAFRTFLNWATVGKPVLLPPPDWEVFAAMFLVTVPLMAIAVTLQISIAVVTRSMKEAQIYLGLLPLIPALPGMVLVFSPLAPNVYTAAVPVFGQMQLLSQLAMGDTVALSHVALASVTTLTAAALIFLLAARWFQREKMFVLG